jgi:Flp pilus assembly protein CpaB
VRLRRLVRNPLAFWTTAVSLALLSALTTARLVGRAASEAARYGGLRPVLVATRAVPVGAPLRAADTAVRRIPAAFVPPGALRSLPTGRRVLVPLFPGQAVLRAHVSPAGVGGLSALLPPGTRALAVPAGEATPPLRVGDTVDVIAVFATDAGAEPAFPVARGARVVAVGAGRVTIAVTPAEAARVAFALAAGQVVLAGVGPS